MTRLRTDQACLEAQMQQQIAQSLNAELAVPCPDCGVESGRACRGDFGRSVVTHLARAVASNRRDTEPCPAPMAPDEARAFVAGQVSLTRAAAREFYEQVITDADRAIRETLQGMQVPRALTQLPWLETAQTGGDFFAVDKTPTASDCAPSPAASAPEAVASTPAEKLCANCSQPLGYGTKVLGNVVIGWHCGDCWSSVNLWDPEQSRTLDQRIREAQPDDATECAWSTPTSDGEGWR